jgi:hypothetical protein
MSDAVFPDLQGLTYPIKRTPTWNTLQQKGLTGIPKFFQLYTYPWYEFTLIFSYLEDRNVESDDIQTLMGFFNTVGGAGQDFLFADPLFEDNTAFNLEFGTGNGSSTTWYLTKTYGGFIEPVFGIKDAPTITSTVSGTTTTLTAGTDYTWSTKGLITFATAPVSGAVLRWTGTWYYRCHFKEDTAEFDTIFYRGHSLDELTLVSVKLQ